MFTQRTEKTSPEGMEEGRKEGRNGGRGGRREEINKFCAHDMAQQAGHLISTD